MQLVACCLPALHLLLYEMLYVRSYIPRIGDSLALPVALNANSVVADSDPHLAGSSHSSFHAKSHLPPQTKGGLGLLLTALAIIGPDGLVVLLQLAQCHRDYQSGYAALHFRLTPPHLFVSSSHLLLHLSFPA